MKNYMHVKNWLKQEKEIYSIEEIKKQIKEGNRIKILLKKISIISPKNILKQNHVLKCLLMFKKLFLIKFLFYFLL